MIVLVLVLALAAGSAPAASPGWVVVQKDGSLVQLAAEPERKGNVLVGSLFPEGKLISIRIDDVDEAKTADANRGRRSGLEKAPAKSLQQGQPALGDRVRLAPPKGVDAAHHELDAARKSLDAAMKDLARFQESVPPDGEKARAAWAQGLRDRKDAVEKGRLRVDRARRRVDELAHTRPAKVESKER